ncbi:ShlB/FhaC/HecB family hemolysin secretion/activation protein [Acetobacter sp. TBRC 12305]|uniref:ShlB/FhaC/HecB family hemolysin secretion/activation protein n=1 Tax=Acetobacter garciniae TaxID=2817435 RepID=UPI001C72CD2E|nr:ShlB/FhaC/HecB family hemolysin secretion/activation protein [Acetobacter garciniae]
MLFPVSSALAQPSLPVLETSPIPTEPPPAQLGAGHALPVVREVEREGRLPSLSLSVRSVSFVGADAFPLSVLNGIAKDLAHRRVTLAVIEQTRLAVVRLYRDHGFLLSTVSMTIDRQANVHFVVTEGYIASVRLAHDIGPAGAKVLALLEHLVDRRPLANAEMERWLLLAQQVSGVRLRAVLQNANREPGALTLIADVSRQAVSAMISADNRGYENTGPEEALVVVHLNSFTSLGERTDLVYYHTAGNTDNFGQLSENIFLGSSGLQFHAYGGMGRAAPSGVLREIDYHSQVVSFGGSLDYPVLLGRRQALTTRLSLDGRDVAISVGPAGLSQDSMRVARANASYAWQDLWFGNTLAGTSTVDITGSQGLPFMGSSANGRSAPPGGRNNARFDFRKISLSISRTQALFMPWQGALVAFRGAAGGQYTPSILPTAEEFYLGGQSFTRGYYSGQVAGDKTAYATAELQLNTTANVELFQRNLDIRSQLYGFYDWGQAWSNQAGGSNPRLASAGVGVKVGFGHNFQMQGEFVHRMATEVEYEGLGAQSLGHTMFYWGATVLY